MNNNSIIMDAFEYEIKHSRYYLSMKRVDEWEYSDEKTQELYQLFRWGWLSSQYHSNGGKYE